MDLERIDEDASEDEEGNDADTEALLRTHAVRLIVTVVRESTESSTRNAALHFLAQLARGGGGGGGDDDASSMGRSKATAKKKKSPSTSGKASWAEEAVVAVVAAVGGRRWCNE